MPTPDTFDDAFRTRRLRLSTLLRLRWLAVVGQTAAVFAVWLVLEFPFPAELCLALIACSAWLNIFLTLRYPANQRLAPLGVFAVLLFDVLQLAGLLALTGGLDNPFSMLLIVPVIISATSLPQRFTWVLSALVVACATILAFAHLPLPWYPDIQLLMPQIFTAGMWIALVSSLAFTSIYAFRVADEARRLSDALAATELVLQREHHLSALDGLAAAAAHELGTPLSTIALTIREIDRGLGADHPLKDDVQLIVSQANRCRDILKRLTTLSAEDEAHMARLGLRALVEEVVAPHRDFGVAISAVTGVCEGPEPIGRRNPAILYGLGNLVENAVDFAREQVAVTMRWTGAEVAVIIADDGPGFSADIIARLGEPDVPSRRNGGRHGGGLGLGVFIAKTLLERTGAEVSFANDAESGGARVSVTWPRASMDAPA